jgi:glycine cleavage system aminomethyltransferase T
MAGEAGYELFGPYEHGETVKDALLEAGAGHAIRRVGAKAYTTAAAESGWVSLPVPAIYTGEAMADYREWLSAKRGTISIGGSFESDDITDYYVTPVELGYGRFIDFDHEFPGRSALAAEVEAPSRQKVTLVWDRSDVVALYAPPFREGEPGKYAELPTPRWAACQYNEVLVDGDHAGVTAWTSYTANERAMLSLAVVDVDHAAPGTEVTIRWGEPAGSPNPAVERHAITDVGATVAKVPYVDDRR